MLIKRKFLVDDLDGSAAAETVRFSLDGQRYEIDLNSGNRDRLRALLARYVEAGRYLRGSRTREPTAADLAENCIIREWAMTRGIFLAAKGAIPVRVHVMYESEARVR